MATMYAGLMCVHQPQCLRLLQIYNITDALIPEVVQDASVFLNGE